jgi:aryl-alcohol dehydrogenase-like predicted oxidoreductase
MINAYNIRKERDITMKFRKIGNSDLTVSQIGLGCMSIGTDEKRAISIIDEALELGVNYLDTADLYDSGLNEEFVGKAIKHKRGEIILATKVGNRSMPGQEGWVWDPSKKYIKEAVKQSLKRLQTDYIDLYQLHGGTMEDPIEETIEAFEELKKEGFIRYYGISSIRPNVIREYIKKSSIVSVMMQYSIFDRRPEEETLDLLKEHNISVIARGPLAKGLLTDKKEPIINYLHLSTEEIQDVLKALKNQFSDRTLSEIALQYCLFSNNVAAVIPGASNIHQVRENIHFALSKALTQEQVNSIRKIVSADTYKKHR